MLPVERLYAAAMTARDCDAPARLEGCADSLGERLRDGGVFRFVVRK